MPPRQRSKKVEVSLTNWVLGGSLISVTKDEEPIPRRRSANRVIVTEIDSDGNEVERHVVPLGKKKGGKTSGDSHHHTHRHSKNNCCCGEDAKCTNLCPNCGGVRDEDLADDEGNGKEPQRKEPQASNAETSGRSWTEEEDKKIQEMKADNKSWKEIVAAVGVSKNQIQRRLKELQRAKLNDNKADDKASDGVKANNDVKASDSVKPDDGVKTDNGVKANDGVKANAPLKANAGTKARAKEAHVRDEPAPVVKKKPVGLGFDFDCLFGDDDSGVDGGVSSNDAPFSTLTGIDGKKKNKKNKKGVKEENELPDPIYLSDEIIGDWASMCANREAENSFDDLEESNHGDEDPNRIAGLVPNEMWTELDCTLLEDLATTQKKNKWLHLQADFFNWTGRMVDSEIIRKKFEADGVAFEY